MNRSEMELFIHNISHEIKNPLTAIKGYAQLLPFKKNDSAFVDKTCGIINQQINRIEGMFSPLFALFALKPFLMDGVNLRSVLETVRDCLSPELKAKVIIDGEAVISTDPALLAKAAGEMILGWNWSNGSSIHIRLESVKDNRAIADFIYTGVVFSDCNDSSFSLPWGCGRYFTTGLELFSFTYIAELLGGTVALRSDKDGFRLTL